MHATTGPLAVLVVEDHEDTSALYVAVLERAGFVAHAVGDVTSARELMADVRFNVLIADYELRGGTAAHLMSICGTTRPSLCILLTGHRKEDVDTDGFQIVLTKPVNVQALVEAVRTGAAGSIR